jgi:hypothetical protein
MWFLTITNQATGPAEEKPALVVDGNMHATEWGGGVAALHFVHNLVATYGTDERVTRLLDTRTVYVLPRMTPDGVDATLDQGRFIRSVDRPYPTALPQSGIIASDVNGDGRSVFMRLRDPNGPWKEYAQDKRLLVPRDPDETGGNYWRVLPEGMVNGYNGVTIDDEPEHEALDFGANFPADLGETPNATNGLYPTSEPEVAAYINAIAHRPNIVAHVTCHTFGGLVLTPPVNIGEKLPEPDRAAYETLAKLGAALTGYRAPVVPRPPQRHGQGRLSAECVRLALQPARHLLVHHRVLGSAESRRHQPREHARVHLALGLSPDRGRAEAPALE